MRPIAFGELQNEHIKLKKYKIMSGGSLDFLSFRIDEACDKIEERVNGKSVDECDVDYYIEDNCCDEEEAEYIRKNLHTKPNPYGYSKSTLKELRTALSLLRKVAVYAHRVEWLFSGDDGEDNFRARLKEDLEKLEGN